MASTGQDVRAAQLDAMDHQRVPCGTSDSDTWDMEEEQDDRSASDASDLDSLFDEVDGQADPNDAAAAASHVPDASVSRPALRTAPPIPGLFFDPSIQLPTTLADALLETCMSLYFRDPDINQIMLFERADRSAAAAPPASTGGTSGLPEFLHALLATLSSALKPSLPAPAHALLFPPPGGAPQARQAILNLYRPGEGIASHVDLLRRFGDGIVGVSLGSGCVMRFAEVGARAAHDVFLPARSVLVLSGDARYRWTHGIGRVRDDWVEGARGDAARGECVARGVRLSITFRWLLPGADTIGGPE